MGKPIIGLKRESRERQGFSSIADVPVFRWSQLFRPNRQPFFERQT
jgi:hypothetical protein